MNARVTWKGNLSMEGASDSGYTLPLGAKKSAGGAEDGFRPMELFEIGLAGCTAMDVISILEKKRQQVTDFEVLVHTKRAQDHPTVFTSAVIEYFVTGVNLDKKALLRSIELSATRYCPAQAMFGKIFPIELKYHIYEDKGEGEREEVTSGVYKIPSEVISPL